MEFKKENNTARLTAKAKCDSEVIMAKEFYESKMEMLFGLTTILLCGQKLNEEHIKVKGNAIAYFHNQHNIIDLNITRAAIARLEEVKLCFILKNYLQM